MNESDALGEDDPGLLFTHLHTYLVIISLLT